MAQLTKVEQYKMMQTKNIPNMKDIIGKTDRPLAAITKDYTSADGEVHNVLVVKFAEAGMYRTEVKAFIEDFMDYWTVFEDDDDRPLITIVGKKSQRGNPYLGMEVAE